jgi:glycosyltransferase involved in cell wall biosynthesis
MHVIFFHRKPRPNFNFSVESLFYSVRRNLPLEVEFKIKEVKYYSNGFLKRLYICFECWFAQNTHSINHVTGDIYFISIFLKRRKTVITILDLGLLNREKSIKYWLLKYFWIVIPCKRSAAITAISESTKQELLKFVKIPADKIKVIYVPISDKFVQKPKQFDKSKPIILQLGTKPNKNVERLVLALKGISCILDIVGEMEERLQHLLIENKVEYRQSKNLSELEIVKKFEASDIVSFSSTYEGFGMPIVEANTVGRVVVTSNILSMPEVAGGAARLVNPFDVNSIRQGILDVIQNDKLRENLILLGFKNAERFNAKNIAAQYTEIYKQLAG